jgi:membrane protein
MQRWWERFAQTTTGSHLIRAVDRFNVRGGGQFAAAISYFSVLSLVPVLMLGFSALGLGLTVVFPAGLDTIESWLSGNLDAYGDLGHTLLVVITNALSDWAAIGLLGLAIALWTGTSWIGNLKRAARALMREDYDNPPKALVLPLDLLVNFGGLLIIFGGVVLTAMATTLATSFSQQVGEWWGLSNSPGWTLTVRGLSLVLSLAAGTLLFWWLFRWFTLRPVSARLLWIGAVVGAAGLTVLQALTGYLIELFSRNLTASLFGPVIILMIFMNLFATLILFVAAWLGTDATPAILALPGDLDSAAEAPPSALESKPGESWVTSEVARRSMGVGMVAGYTVGTATGLGLGALIARALASLFGRKD